MAVKQERAKVIMPGMVKKLVVIVEGASTNPVIIKPLKVDDERIHKNSSCVGGFDGGGKDSVGDIVLELTIGPVEFTMEFQVLDVAVSYNPLLGRPWIHDAKAVPSTLHQMVKFEWDREEIVVHGEDNWCVLSDAIVPFIEFEDDKGPWVYQVFDTVSVEKIPEGKYRTVGVSPQKFGYIWFGVQSHNCGCERARKLKQRAWVLPKPIPRLSRSFVRSGTKKRPVTTVPSSVIDVDRDLIGKFERLFADVNMLEAGEGLSKVDVQFVGPSAKTNNWEATPLPTRKEFCLKSQSNSEIVIQKIECDYELEYDKDEAFEEISKELSHFEEKPKPNLSDTEAINLGDPNNIQKTKISVHLELQMREEIIKALFEFKDIFAWSYNDMPGLSTDLVVHILPTDPVFPHVKQKLRKIKTDMSVKIKEETYFPDEEVMHIDELQPIEKPRWKLFFDGAANMKSVGIGAIQVREQYAYCNVVEEELDGEPWFHDIKEYIRMGVYPVQAIGDQKRTIRRLASGVFFSGGILYKRTPYLELLRCTDAKQATTIMTEVRDPKGETPYLLVYVTKAVIPAEVEISSLRIVTEAKIDDDEWVKTRLEQLSLIDEKRLAAVCHGLLYQQRMARAYNKKVHPRKFEVGQLVLKRILPHQAEEKGSKAAVLGNTVEVLTIRHPPGE
ncbi:uncharacterized protein [Nicotiana sylvestris]|uniref:uncharacterized protein n=1 Tax=Nicotiana sylvestris TaxID=4096 RepID=UPI00388CB58F